MIPSDHDPSYVSSGGFSGDALLHLGATTVAVGPLVANLAPAAIAHWLVTHDDSSRSFEPAFAGEVEAVLAGLIGLALSDPDPENRDLSFAFELARVPLVAIASAEERTASRSPQPYDQRLMHGLLLSGTQAETDPVRLHKVRVEAGRILSGFVQPAEDSNHHRVLLVGAAFETLARGREVARDLNRSATDDPLIVPVLERAADRDDGATPAPGLHRAFARAHATGAAVFVPVAALNECGGTATDVLQACIAAHPEVPVIVAGSHDAVFAAMAGAPDLAAWFSRAEPATPWRNADILAA